MPPLNQPSHRNASYLTGPEPSNVVGGFWAQLRSEIGLDDVRLHDLRHNYASYAARKSETLPMIGSLLGHTGIGSTNRYAHLDDGTLLEAADRVGEAIEIAIGQTIKNNA